MAKREDSNLEMPQSLMDAGCDAELVEQFFHLHARGNNKAQLHLLRAHRQSLLDSIHKTKKCLDCLDYLLYRMRKGNIT